MWERGEERRDLEIKMKGKEKERKLTEILLREMNWVLEQQLNFKDKPKVTNDYGFDKCQHQKKSNIKK